MSSFNKIEEGQPFLGLVLNRAEKKAHAQRLLIHLPRVLTPLLCFAVMCFTYAQREVFVLLDGIPFDLLELNH